MAMCLSRPQSVMTFCQSEMERPYFFSIEGKYEGGPTFGHGGEYSANRITPLGRRHKEPYMTASTARLHR